MAYHGAEEVEVVFRGLFQASHVPCSNNVAGTGLPACWVLGWVIIACLAKETCMATFGRSKLFSGLKVWYLTLSKICGSKTFPTAANAISIRV